MAEYKVRLDQSVPYDDRRRVYDVIIVDDPVLVARINQSDLYDRFLYTSRVRLYTRREDGSVETYYQRIYCETYSHASGRDPLKVVWETTLNVSDDWLTVLVEEKLAKEQNNG